MHSRLKLSDPAPIFAGARSAWAEPVEAVNAAFSRSNIYVSISNINVMLPMNSKQMKKWLEQQGATFAPGKGSHLKVFLNARQSVLPMHGTRELGKGLEEAIKRQLGLK